MKKEHIDKVDSVFGKREATPYEYEARLLLDLIDAEWRSDPQSVECFDLRVVERVRKWLRDAPTL